MKLKIVLLFIGLVLGSYTHAQIKIGSNPQNINPASVLELESTSRALVLTRVNTAQMNAINPLQGALVYNTETKCVHYYDGGQWLNICDALTNSVNISLENNQDGTYTFTDANGIQTVITNTTNSTFEVANDSLVLTDSNNNALSVALDSLNRHTYSTDAIVNTKTSDSTIVITKTNNNYNFEIAENSISFAHIGPTQVRGSYHIQNRSVTPIKIQPGTVGQILQTQLTGTPTLTETAVWVSKNGLFSAAEISYNPVDSGLAATNVKLAIDELSTSSNSLTIGDILTQGNDAGAQLIRNILDPSSAQDAATRNYVDNAITGSNALPNANIFVGDATGAAQPVLVSGDATMDNTGFLTIADNAITSSKILDGTIDSADIAVNAIGTPQLANNAVTSAIILDGEVRTADLANNAVTNVKVVDGGITSNKILDANVTLGKLADGTAAGQLMQWDGANWVLVDETALTITEVDGSTTNEITDVIDNLDGTTTITDVNGGTVTVDNDGVDNVDDADNNPTNEITDVIDNLDGTTTITDVNGGTVTLDNDGVDNVDDADNNPTNEITDVIDNLDGTTSITDVNGGTVTVDNDGVDNVDDADNNPTNEITDVIDNLDGTTTITDVNGGTVTLDNDGVDNVDDADNNPTNEITDVIDNLDGTTTITDVNGGTVTVDNDGVDNVDDADNNPTNEITDVIDNLDGTTTITDVNGGTVTVDNDGVDNVDDADNNPTNEITDVINNLDGTTTITDVNGGTVTVDNDGVDNVDDDDNNPTNEIQTLTSNDGSLTLTPSGIADYDLSVTNRIVAMGKINDAGNALRITPGVTSRFISSGIYEINLSSLGLTDADYIINATAFSGTTNIINIQVTQQSPTTFTVAINNASGLVNGFWYFTVTDF